MHLTLRTPDDWHCHFRDNAFLARTVIDSAKQFNRVVAMPNLTSPIDTLKAAIAYKNRIISHAKSSLAFTPLSTLYLTQTITPALIKKAKDTIFAVKFYPAHATTGAAFGASDIRTFYSVFDAMQDVGLPLLMHGEVTHCDVFDREARFIDSALTQLVKDFPALKITLEHITTKHAVDFVTNASTTLGATITPQHLLLDRNDMLANGIKPHLYCKPILKRETDRNALLTAATSGHPRFFLGTDSAPHTRSSKESACGCAGCYSSYAAIELYAMAFDNAGKINQLEQFASVNGATFYNQPLNDSYITLTKESWQAPNTLSFGSETLIPLLAGETITWKQI